MEILSISPAKSDSFISFTFLAGTPAHILPDSTIVFWVKTAPAAMMELLSTIFVSWYISTALLKSSLLSVPLVAKIPIVWVLEFNAAGFIAGSIPMNGTW